MRFALYQHKNFFFNIRTVNFEKLSEEMFLDCKLQNKIEYYFMYKNKFFKNKDTLLINI
jgi:hypothetical protein